MTRGESTHRVVELPTPIHSLSEALGPVIRRPIALGSLGGALKAASVDGRDHRNVSPGCAIGVRMPPKNSRMKQIRRGVSPGSVSTSKIGPGPSNRETDFLRSLLFTPSKNPTSPTRTDLRWKVVYEELSPGERLAPPISHQACSRSSVNIIGCVIYEERPNQENGSTKQRSNS